LVQKETNPKDQRGYIYRPTFELLSYLGISKVEELPEYKLMNEEVDQFIENEKSNKITNEAEAHGEDISKTDEI